MMNALVPVVCLIFGAIVYLGADGKFSELGRLVFLAGALVLAWLLSDARVHF